MKSISVFCGSSEGNDNYIISQSYSLGVEFAKNDITLVYGAARIGVMGQVAKGVIDNNGKTIGVIPEFLKLKDRVSEIIRNTNETKIYIKLNLDGTGKSVISTGIAFFDHMLDQIARHGLIDLDIDAKGDLHIDGHHTVEDVGITLGMAVAQAVGDKKGLRRYGHAYVPLDEALSRVVIDFSGRPSLHYTVPFTRAAVGDFDVDLFSEFFHGLVNHAQLTLHIDNLKGDNSHHQAETVFKAFGRAVRMAVELDPRSVGVVPSTKGSL